jgi:hypothetical protein
MMAERLKSWSRLGVAVVAGSVAAAPLLAAGHAMPMPKKQIILAQAAQGGEGGEGAAGAPPDGLAGAGDDMALAVRLGMVRGHLIAAEALINLGDYRNALPHIHHPLEEIWPDLQAPFAARNIAGFAETAAAITRALGAADRQASLTAIGQLRALCDKAEASLPKAADPAFAGNAAVRLMRMAMPEYEGAIEDGRLVNVVEYQDAMGFLTEASRRLTAISSAIQDADARGDMERAIQAILESFPSINPPEKPVRTGGAITGLISLIELSLAAIRQ